MTLYTLFPDITVGKLPNNSNMMISMESGGVLWCKLSSYTCLSSRIKDMTKEKSKRINSEKGTKRFVKIENFRQILMASLFRCVFKDIVPTWNWFCNCTGIWK